MWGGWIHRLPALNTNKKEKILIATTITRQNGVYPSLHPLLTLKVIEAHFRRRAGKRQKPPVIPLGGVMAGGGGLGKSNL